MRHAIIDALTALGLNETQRGVVIMAASTLILAAISYFLFRGTIEQRLDRRIDEAEGSAKSYYRLAKTLTKLRGKASDGGSQYTDDVLTVFLVPKLDGRDNVVTITYRGKTVLSAYEWWWRETGFEHGSWVQTVSSMTNGPWQRHLDRLRPRLDKEDEENTKRANRETKTRRLNQLGG
jgi:hypothetical protein